MEKHLTRMGDGKLVEMSSDELRHDLEGGSEDAADKGKIEPLSRSEIDSLFDIFTDSNKHVSVAHGNEVVLTDDVGHFRLIQDNGGCGIGIPLNHMAAVMLHERGYGMDTTPYTAVDATFKSFKPIMPYFQQEMEIIIKNTIIPIYFCAMPNLSAYYYPDGPFPNPSDLLPAGKVKEALEAQEKAVEHLTKDLIFCGEKIDQIGCDSFNFDTVGSAGDGDFLATLRAVEHLKKNTNMGIVVGMASEFVLGMHGGFEYRGERLAGMYPNEQAKMVESAGADIFGPVINTNTRKSVAWNVARTTAFSKSCSEAVNIPIHPNVGMGVGGVPMCETPPADAVTRASKSLVEIGKADGL